MPLYVKNISKSVDIKVLLNNASFIIGPGVKAALIGPNGCGKTTLFKMILGETQPDSGSIYIENERIGYIPQEFILVENQTVEEYFLTYVMEENQLWKVEKVLSHLGIDDLPYEQKVSTLSEGQKLKLTLAGVMVQEPTLLLLDEPTNHLDIVGILWFEEVLQNFKGGVLMISHDRSFLDNTVNTMYEFDEQAINTFPGNYTQYKEQKEGWVEKRAQVFKAQDRKRKQLEKLLVNARKLASGKQRGKAVRAAKKRMYREVEKSEIQEYQPYEVSGMDVAGSTHAGKLILSVKDIGMSYGDKKVFEHVDFELRGHQRIWLAGPNGAGKTTLLNLITQRLTPQTGTIRMGENVAWGYFRQNQEHLPMQMTVREYLQQFGWFGEHKVFQFLKKYNYPREYSEWRLGKLSPGERARLSFALFTTGEYTFLILDEPTNHLDVWTKEAIESSLADYMGAILLVSHDRYFVENVGIERVLNLVDGVLSYV